MRKMMAYIVFIIILAGCNPYEPTAITRIPKADIVYQTIINNKDYMGFYTLSENTPLILTIDAAWAKMPIWIKPGIISIINKGGFPGSMIDYGGTLEIWHDGKPAYKCSSDAKHIEAISIYQKNVVYFDDVGLEVFDVNYCEISETLVLMDEIKANYKDVDRSSFAVFNNQPYALFNVVDNDDNFTLIRYGYQDHSVYDYKRKGFNPAISPDEKKIAYVMVNKIHVMDVDGNNDEVITTVSALGQHFPIPRWSPDGKKLIYDKCYKTGLDQCPVSESYSVYIYDLETKEEKLIVDNAFNPSWYPE
jgi:hypothetical protein